MTPSEVAVRAWQDAAPVLERLRRRELRELSEEHALEAMLDLLDLTTVLPPKTGGSGLVEQQRYFVLAGR